MAPYLADNATLPQPLSVVDESVADYDPKAMSVFTGLVTDRYGIPISDATVSFLKARNYGSVQTDSEGRFILTGPSGSQTLTYEKPNHLVVQRTATASSSQWATLETVILLPRDAKVTHIDLTSGVPQVHQSSVTTDEFGERRATVIFNDITSATIRSEDGTTRPLNQFLLSATEFEVPASMPGKLPVETAFTWANDLHIENTHFTDSVHFNGNVVMYVDNFLNFPVGEIVPIGYFDRHISKWVASDNGVVVQLLDQDGDGVVDGVDYTGDLIADDLNGNGSTADEAIGLENYVAGDTLWWGSFNHMTPYDYNLGLEDAEVPEEVSSEDEEEISCDEQSSKGEANTGSIMDAYQQTFHEEIPIAGTNITLNYSSHRVSGYSYKIRVRVSGDDVPASVQSMIARLEIGGHVFEQKFFPESNVVAEFVWDGNHLDGTRAQDLVSGRVSIGYEYQTRYLSSGNAAEEDRPLSDFPVAWATLSDVATQVPVRETFIAWQQKGITVKNTYATHLAEGWSLSAVHEFDPKGKVYLGSGKVFDVAIPSLILKTGLSYSHVYGDDGYYQQGGRDIDYTITDRNTLVDRVTGLEWQYTQQPYRTASRAEAAAYCENEAEPRNLNWRLPTEKEAGYALDKSGGHGNQRIYSMSLVNDLWSQNTANTDNRLIGTVCVSGSTLGDNIDEQLERNNADEVVVDKENGLMWQDALDNEVLTLDWEGSINYCEDSLHAGYDDWRLPNINELLYVLPNATFAHQTTLPPSFGIWNQYNPHRNPYWSSTTNIYNEDMAWVAESNSFNNFSFVKEDAYHVRCVRNDSTASRMPLSFNGNNQHVASFDMLSGTEYQFIDYNADGQVTGVEDQFGNRLTIERDGLGIPYRLVAPNGQITELMINSENHLTQITYEDASRYDFSYSEGGLLTEKIDPRGERYTRQYNSIGRVEQAGDPAGGFWQTFNNKLGLHESLFGYTTAEGNTQQVEQRVLPNGDTLQTTTTLSGAERVRLISEDKLTESITAYGMSQVIHKELDEKTLQPVPRQITVTAPSGLTRTTAITKAFAQNGADTSAYTLTVDANGDISTTSVNGRNGTWVHTSAEGRTATILTDPETLLTERIQVPGLHDSHSVYDDRGRLIEAHTGDRVTTYSYNANGYLASITASDNRRTEFEYDLLGRTTRIHYPDGFSTAFEYDANGNAAKVTVPTQEAHDFTFTAINLVETENQPPATITAYTYNREKALTEIQLPSGESIHYDYQNARLQQMQTPEGITEYRYQQGDQLFEVQTGTELVRYHYDGTLLTGLEYEGDLNTRIDYGYDNHFRTNQVSYAGSSTAIGYDQDGLMTSIHGYSVDYHPQNGLPEQIENSTWRKQWSWTPYGEVSAVSHQLGAQESYGYALEYNQAGQISGKTERRHDGSLVTYDYAYDNRYRLIEVRENNTVTESYSYDANGNRTSVTSVHRDINSQGATYATGDQLQSQGDTTYSYDANGRLSSRLTIEDELPALTTYVYSSLGQLLQVDTPEQSIEYHHNALGQRVAKLVNGQVTEKYLWRDLITLLAVYDVNGNVKQRFEHTLGHTPTSFTQNGQRYFIQSDHLGSPRVITDSSSNVVKTIDYDSYGNIIHDSNESFEIPFGFAGGLHDRDTGLIRFGYRDYDPDTGRWTARDPIGFAGGDTNLYGYVLGDPVNWVDVDGLKNARPISNSWNRFQARHGGRGYTKSQLQTLYRQLKLNKLGGVRNPELHTALENFPDRVEEVISIPSSCLGAVCQVEVEVCLCSKSSPLSCPRPGERLELPWEELKKDCSCWTEYRAIPGL